jgi:hypothetical protein
MKIALQNKHFTNDDRYQYINWKTCLPFLENKRAVLIHRPRAISTVAKSAISKHSYLIAKMWCGTSMTNGENWTFLESPPDGKVICAKCEAMAIVNGFPSSYSLVGHHVHVGGVRAFITCCKEDAKND